MNSGPVAQFRPMEKSGACDTLAHSASTPCPASIVPVGSMVPDSRIGTRVPVSANACSSPMSAVLTLRVSCCVSTSSTSTFPSRRPIACSRKFAVSSSNVMPPVTLIAFVVGPMLPATNLGLSGVEYAAAVRLAISAARRFSARVSSERPYSPSTIGVPPKVFVSTRSAPTDR